ncbi:hypothetical protein N7516_010133 [Penicillium verrucosum]|uniref:uncharacterized protein n=1 Tax=Penicillium verrucosum TaxID=60171 RepID=UPI002544E4CB|nr:uncharacterized protein N7516_010133 [Penicillium verrucosum]KAJ5922430.1 hypothetical protein N7516_010133 [Penicillium verrucosum]
MAAIPANSEGSRYASLLLVRLVSVYRLNADFPKCDELQPVCGTCSSRGEPCSYPPPRLTLKRPPRSRADTEEGDGYLLPDSFAPSDEGPPLGCIQPLSINATAPAITSDQSHQHRDGDLNMDDLKLLQFYHLYTARQMTLHHRRSQTWQHIIPELASENRYLMHLLLALGGIHMVKQKADANTTVVFEDSDTVGLAIVMEHHQRGLEGFREDVSRISPSNAEAVFTGSILLVAFAFAFLKIQDLNPLTEPTKGRSGAMADPLSTNTIPRLNWLYLNRGVTSVIGDQWQALKSSRLRQILSLQHSDEYWVDSSSNAPSRLSRCAPRLLKFADGARQAVASIKASLNTLEHPWDDLSSCSGTPTSQTPPPTTLDWAMDAHNETIRILEFVYSRILSVLGCASTETPTDKEIQLDLEEAAILSWPNMLPSAFLASLESSDSDHNCLRGLSLVILAHFYLVNTLVDTWYMRGSFENEILRTHALIGSLDESHLSTFMIWPNEVMNLPLTCTS